MWKTPGFTSAAIAMLALGFGLTGAVMSLASALFLRLCRSTKRRGSCSLNRRGQTGRRLGILVSDYLYLRERSRAFYELAAHYSTMPPMSVATTGGVSACRGPWSPRTTSRYCG